MHKKIKKYNDLVNKKKLIYIPALLITFVILFFGIFSIEYSKSMVYKQLKIDALNFTQQTVKHIEHNQETKNAILSNMEDKMSIAGKMIFENKDSISNSWLRRIADDFGIEEIDYYTPTGKVIFSTYDEDVGIQVSLGDPVYSFMSSNKKNLHEDVRKSIDRDIYYKFSFFRDDDGDFVELGIVSDKVYSDTKLYDYQNMVDDISKNQNVYYALITNSELVEIADSDLYDIGTDWKSDHEYSEVLKGNSLAYEWYYEKTNRKVLEVAVPIIIDGNIVGVFAVGHSLEVVNDLIKTDSFRMIFIIVFVLLILIWSQKKYIIQPILKLNNELMEIDINISGNQLATGEEDLFKGVYSTINNLLYRIDENVSNINQIKSCVEYSAYHDSLTGIKNRRALFEDLDCLLSENQQGALCMFELNNLKEINDTYGQRAGDDTLCTVAHGITQAIKKGTTLYRFAGDKFIAIILRDIGEVEKECIDIMNCIDQPITSDNMVIDTACCMGITLFSKENNGASELISKADTTMYYVKNNFKKGYTYFMPFMQEALNKKTEISNVLRNAIKENGFKLLYQPIVHTNTGEIVSFEALLRLRDYNISPMEFIKVAEENGMINDIGRFVIKETICQLHEWKEKGISIKPIAVNLSPKQIKDIGLIDYIQNLLIKYAIESQFISIEITEDVLVEDSAEAIKFLENLKSIGVNIYLDDFGSGYSSLTYLTYMPIDKIKLDKSLNDRYLNKDYYGIIGNIINIAHELNLLVIAEGIESIEQHEILKEVSCDFIQGYLFSKPVDAEIAKRMLESQYLINI
ncbi:MAG: putative bifunctional diguanylate cyclase/phosphodiesterase [Sedimentibacter sp.]